jgi:hypothetical protein
MQKMKTFLPWKWFGLTLTFQTSTSTRDFFYIRSRQIMTSTTSPFLPMRFTFSLPQENSYQFSMAKLHLLMALFPFFLLHFLSLLLPSSANYTLPTLYFINCGSKSNITVGGRNFVGDLNSGSFSVGTSSGVSETNSATDMSLYQTARIFENPSSYEFNIINHGIYYVRLHFFPFLSGKTNLANALFDVSTSNFSLLSNFGVKENSNSPVIEEFLLTINGSKFNIHFTPHRKSFAFVSAIEVFLIPDDGFVMDDFPLVTPTGSNQTYVGVRSQVLRTIHRVNVGGPQNNDSLWRTWLPDDDYLLSPGSAKICPPYNGTLKYDVLGATNYSASDLIYRTCKELNSNSSDITWRFVCKEERQTPGEAALLRYC